MRELRLRHLLCLLSILLCSCRYSSVGSLDAQIKTIGVTMLRNNTRVAGLESEITRSVVAALHAGGRLRVVDAEGDPDLVLTGRVIEYRKASARADRYGDPVQFQVAVSVQISVRNHDGSYLIKDLTVKSGKNNPGVGSVDLGTGQRESHGRSQAVEDIGRAVVRYIVERGW
jgi:Lipopolysaccharide-assembly